MASAKIVALALLLSVTAVAEEQHCRREEDGRVSCSADGFRILTDSIVTARADAKKCAASLDDGAARLTQCRDSLRVSTEQKPVEPPEDRSKPLIRRLIGLGIGMAAAATAVMAAKADVDEELRLTVITASAFAATTSLVLVAW